MTAIRIESFMGMAPKLSNRLLPDNAASLARNARLLSGELRGIKAPSRIHRFATGTVKNVKRIYKSDGTPVWLGLSEADSDIVKGPLVNDAYDRYYWSGQEAYIAYNSLARIENGDPSYKLGLPGPTAAPSLAVVGGTGSTETRAYTYTFVNTWGEESPPAPVVSVSGAEDGSWNLSAIETAGNDMTNRLGISHKRLYRTVTGQASVAYYYVADVPLANATYNDTSPNATVVLNNLLQSFSWQPPDTSLQGLVAHPAGFLCAFTGTDIYFSERYRPHAWPVEYALSVEHDIVGLAIYNNMITVLTKGQPYFLQGSRPESITPIKSEAAEPCLSKASIASTLSGVLYSSPNGLVLYNETGPSVVTKPIMSVEEWANYTPSAMRGAQYGEQYIAYFSNSTAIRYAPREPFGVFSEIDKFDAVDNIVTDDTTGELWLVRFNDVYQWEPPSGIPLYYEWVSKVYDFTRPINFGAYYLKAEGLTIEQTVEAGVLYAAYNTAIFDADPPGALNPVNFTPLNGKRSFTVNVGTTPEGIDEIPQNQFPLGGSPMYNLEDIQSVSTQVALTVYADGREIFTKSISPNTLYRMPSGFKAHTWQFKFVGNMDVYSFGVAETPKGLVDV